MRRGCVPSWQPPEGLKDLTPATLVPAAPPHIGRSPDRAAPKRLISLGSPSHCPDRVRGAAVPGGPGEGLQVRFLAGASSTRRPTVVAGRNTVVSRIARRAPSAYGRPSRSTTRGGFTVELYGILRRNGWASPEDLQAAAARSTEAGDKEGSGVRWIRSYVIAEDSGEVGTFCVYEADSPDAIRAHAAAA